MNNPNFWWLIERKGPFCSVHPELSANDVLAIDQNNHDDEDDEDDNDDDCFKGILVKSWL